MSTLTEAIEQQWAEEEGRRPASDVYEGEPCVQCHRIRVMFLKNGRRQCEKCETIQP